MSMEISHQATPLYLHHSNEFFPTGIFTNVCKGRFFLVHVSRGINLRRGFISTLKSLLLYKAIAWTFTLVRRAPAPVIHPADSHRSLHPANDANLAPAWARNAILAPRPRSVDGRRAHPAILILEPTIPSIHARIIGRAHAAPFHRLPPPYTCHVPHDSSAITAHDARPRTPPQIQAPRPDDATLRGRAEPAQRLVQQLGE